MVKIKYLKKLKKIFFQFFRKDVVFLTGSKHVNCTIVKFDPLNDRSNDELHIILKRRNFKICEHSSFLIIDDTVF